jgi:hypothetical protein
MSWGARFPIIPHWFGAVGGPVELILIVGPQGERPHLHQDQ